MLKYKEIEDTLKEQIVTGKYPEGTLLPKQETLAHSFHTSRITVRKALQQLIDQGIVYTRRGAGTFVANHLRQSGSDTTQTGGVFGTTGHARGEKVTSRLLRFEVRFPTENEQQALHLAETDPVYDIKRIRDIDGKASSIETSIMPFKLIPGITKTVLAGSVYGYIQTQLGLKIVSAQRVIIASKADELDAKTFGIAPGEPILETNQVVFLDDGAPFDLSKTRYPYTSGKIVANINRNQLD